MRCNGCGSIWRTAGSCDAFEWLMCLLRVGARIRQYETPEREPLSPSCSHQAASASPAHTGRLECGENSHVGVHSSCLPACPKHSSSLFLLTQPVLLPQTSLLLVLSGSPSQGPRKWARPHKHQPQSSLARCPCCRLPPDMPTQTLAQKVGHQPSPGLECRFRP